MYTLPKYKYKYKYKYEHSMKVSSQWLQLAYTRTNGLCFLPLFIPPLLFSPIPPYSRAYWWWWRDGGCVMKSKERMNIQTRRERNNVSEPIPPRSTCTQRTRSSRSTHAAHNAMQRNATQRNATQRNARTKFELATVLLWRRGRGSSGRRGREAHASIHG